MRIQHMAVLLLLVATTAFASDPPPVPNEIVPFTTDGCSAWPSGDWIDCCILHDFAHWKGGTLKEKAKADVELASCVFNTGDGWLRHILNAPLAGLMLIGGSIGGLAQFPTPVRWGYGWKFDREYEPLTPELQKLVDANTPPDILALKPTPLHDNTKPYPSETGNYCVDELYRIFTKYAQERNVPVSLAYERVAGPTSTITSYRATLNSSMCKNAEYNTLFLIPSDAICTEPQSRDDVTHYFSGFWGMSDDCPDFNSWYQQQARANRSG